MTDPVGDEFGAGLVVPGQQAAAVTTETSVTPVPGSDSFLQEFKSRFGGLPDDITREQLDDYLIGVNEKARKYEETEAKYAALEAQIAASVAQQPVVAPQVPQTPAQQAAAVRRWEATKVDEQFKSYVKPDPSGFGYIPLNAGNIAHIRAAEAMNQKAERDARFSQAFLADPYATAEELVQARFEAMEAKFQKELEEYKKQFAPIQEQAAMSALERDTQAFIEKNKAKLFAADDTFTPIGQEVDFFMREFNLTAAQALEKAEKRLGVAPATPAVPVQPVSISKAKPAEKPPANRFVDRLSPASRLPVDQPEFEGGSGKKRPTMADLNKQFGIPNN